MSFSNRWSYRLLALGAVLGLFSLLLAVLKCRLAIAYQQTPVPQAILVLGGDLGRERHAAEMAQAHSQLPIWVSTGISNTLSQKVFRSADIALSRVRLDRRAVDTVTNFTTLLTELQQANIQHVYIVTSDYHMRRACAIAFFVLGSRGIAFTPVSVPSERPQESRLRALRDAGRAAFWLATGRSGAILHNTPLDP
ncbi:MAG: YdcF family protein [Elainellaceae cyanobacterium]